MQLWKLDLRTLEGAWKGGERGASIVPAKAEDSRWSRRVAGLERPAMPMDGKLTGDQISTIKAWIDQGAYWDVGAEAKAPSVDPAALAALENMEISPEARNYWAFKLPLQAPVPNVSANLRNPIDRFLEKTRREKDLKAAEQQVMSVHDLHATILHLLGLEHTKLTYRFNGRDMRLTDVYGELIPQIVS